MKAGAVYKYDLSIPLENLYTIVKEMRSRLGKKPYILLVISYQCILGHKHHYNFV